MRKFNILFILILFVITGICTAQSVNEDNNQTVPVQYKLYQNYPNPFNPTTEVKYSLPEVSFVSIKVFNSLGNEVTTLVNEVEPAGNYKVVFNGKDLSSGIYYLQLKANDFLKVKKMILIK